MDLVFQFLVIPHVIGGSFFCNFHAKALIVDKDVPRGSEDDILDMVDSQECLIIGSYLWLDIQFQRHLLSTLELKEDASVDVLEA